MYIEANSVLDYTPAKAFKSGTLRIPETQENFKVLGNVWDRRSEINQVFSNVVYELNNIKYLGELQLIGVSDNGVLEAQFITGAANLNFGDKNLRELDYSDWNHPLTYDNILESQNNELPYLYDVINRGRFEDTEKLHVNERFPAIRLRALLDKALEGWNLVGGILDDIEDLFELFTESRDVNNDNEWADNSPFLAEIEDGQSESDAGQGSAINETHINEFVVSEGDLQYGEYYNTTTNRFETTEAGSYRFIGNIPGSCILSFDRPDDDLIAYMLYVEIVDQANVAFWRKEFNLKEILTDPKTLHVFNLDIETGYIHIPAGRDLVLRVRINFAIQQAPGDAWNINSSIGSGTTLECKASRWFATGETVEFEKIVPDKTINDFISEFLTDFGQQVYINAASKTLYFRGFGYQKTNKFLTDKVVGVKYSIPDKTNYVVHLQRDDNDNLNREAANDQIYYRDIVENAIYEEVIELSYAPSFQTLCMFKPLFMRRFLSFVDDKTSDEEALTTNKERRIMFFDGIIGPSYDMAFGNVGNPAEIHTFIGIPAWSKTRGFVDLSPEGMHGRYHKAGIDILRADRVEAEIFYDTKDFLEFLYPTDDVGLQIQKIINRGTDSFYLKIETIETNGVFSKVTGFRLL